MQQPLISIITVCFNSAKTIKHTIESVLNQTYTNIEYILIDGKSTDNTLEIIKEYVRQFAAKGITYRYISEPDQGIYDAMNKGIKLASGQWLNFQGSDDWLELDACKNIVLAIEESDASIIYGLTKCYKNNQPVALEQVYHTQLPNRMTCHQAIFYNKELHKTYSDYSTKYRICSDYEFLLKCFLANVKFMPINNVTAHFSLNGTNDCLHYITMQEMIKIKMEYNLATYKQFIFIKFKSHIFRLLRRFNLALL